MADDSEGTKFIGNLVGLYVVTVMGMGVYYNWQYAREHGFVQWFFLGEVVPSAKALVWPYFVFGTDKTSQPPLTSQGPPRTSEEWERNRILAQQDHDRQAIFKFNEVTRKLTELTKLNLIPRRRAWGNPARGFGPDESVSGRDAQGRQGD